MVKKLPTCSHPAQIHGVDGVLRCLICGEEILPEVEKPKRGEDKKPEDTDE